MTEKELRSKIKDFLKEHWPDDVVYQKRDDEVINWVPDTYGVESGYDDEFSWYDDHMSTEAEDVIEGMIKADIKEKLGFDIDKDYEKSTGEDFVDLLEELYEFINWR